MSTGPFLFSHFHKPKSKIYLPQVIGSGFFPVLSIVHTVCNKYKTIDNSKSADIAFLLGSNTGDLSSVTQN